MIAQALQLDNYLLRKRNERLVAENAALLDSKQWNESRLIQMSERITIMEFERMKNRTMKQRIADFCFKIICETQSNSLDKR